jgi:hypothetical protein
MGNSNSNFTVGLRDDKLEVIIDWADVDGLDEAVELALALPQVKELNPGSDYTEQYFDIEVSANCLYIIFRKE